ncbi:hypothetical protein NB689_001558 [Xanthomonas sacchari]|nr:hypothetical protein [Xanthomonas sacchari]
MHRFDAGVDREDVGLECDRIDHLDDLVGACRTPRQLLHRLTEAVRRLHALAGAVVGAGRHCDHRAQVAVRLLQALQQLPGGAQHGLQRLQLGLGLPRQFVVLGDHVRHVGGDLQRQRHRLADRLGQVAETGRQAPPRHRLGLLRRQRRLQPQIQIAAGQPLADPIQQRLRHHPLLDPLRQRLQRRAGRTLRLALGEQRDVAQQCRGFRMRQRQQPALAATIAVALVAHAARGIAPRRLPTAFAVDQGGQRQAPDRLAGGAEQRFGRDAQQVQGGTVGGTHATVGLQPQQRDRRIRQTGNGRGVGIGTA